MAITNKVGPPVTGDDFLVEQKISKLLTKN